MLFISASSSPSAAPRRSSNLRTLLIAASTLVLPAALQAQVLSYAGLETALPVTGLTAPSSIAIDASGNGYIVNRHASNVTELTSGLAQNTIPVVLNDPYAIAVDSSSNLYIADYGANQIVKVPAGGGVATNLGAGLTRPTGVAVDTAGNVYIADSGNGRLLKIAAAGGAQTVLASGAFTTPVGLAIDSSNNLYVSDTGAQKLFEVTITGTVVTATTLLSGLSDLPNDVAVDAAGDVLLSGGNSHYIKLYPVPAQLGSSGVVRLLGTSLSDPTGITVSSGYIFVADQTAPAIALIAPGSVDLGSANLCPAGASATNCSQSATLYFNVAAGQTISSVSARVVTQGGANLDFTSTGNTCTGALTGATTCSVTVAFNPLAPGTRLGAVDVLGIAGSASSATLLASVPLHGLGNAPIAGFDAGTITSLPLTLGINPYLSSVIADSAGNLYFVDNDNCVVDKFNLATGVTTVVAGTGACGAPSGAGGPATSAVLQDPWRLALDGRGDLYISDDLAAVIWKVDALTQIITAAAGTPGTAGHSADGAVAAGATLDRPYALAIDGAGDLYFTDYADETVRRIDATTGVLSTVAGNYNDGQGFSGDGGPATLAQLNNPVGLALDSNNDIFIADLTNDVVRGVDAATGIITTVAGVPSTTGYSGDGGLSTSAELSGPEGVAADAAGNLYIADTNNFAVRKVSIATGIISTIAGAYSATPTSQDSGDGGAANLAGLSDVSDVTLDSSGNLYIADVTNQTIRAVTPASGVVVFGTVNVGSTSPAIDVAVTNNGNTTLDLSSLVAASNFDYAGVDSSCTASTTLNPGASCILGVEFSPSTAGGLAGNFTLTDNAGNAPAATQTLALTGTGAYVATQVVLAGVPATIAAGSNLGAITASIESSGGNIVTNSSATVTATVTGPGSYSQSVTATAAAGVATLNLSSLTLSTAGAYTVTASSPGLTSSSVTVTVTAAAAKIAVSGLPTSITAGGNLGQETATIETSTGSVVSTSTAAVTVTITATGYSHAVTANAVAGVATVDLSAIPLTAAGAYTVTTSSPGLPSTTNSVTVNAIDFTLGLSSGSSSTQTVAAGAAATYTLTLAPTANAYAQPITFSASGLPSGATATFSPTTVTPGSSPVTTTLTIQTAAATSALHDLNPFSTSLGSIALALLLLPLGASRRLRQAAKRMPIPALLAILSLGALFGLTGCGGGSSSPKSQTYTITITGTSGSLSHTTTVTLIVQ